MNNKSTVNMSNKCCIGDQFNQICDLNKKNVKVEDLSEEDKKILLWRISGLTITNEEIICQNHFNKYMKYYHLQYTYCCDPFSSHSKKVTSFLRTTTLNICQDLKKACEINIIPGTKVCTNCNKEIVQMIKNYEDKFKYCADPFLKHRTKVNKELLIADENFFKYLENVKNIVLLPGQKLCVPCDMKLHSDILENKEKSMCIASSNSSFQEKSSDELNEINTPSSEASGTSESSDYNTPSQKKRKLDSVLEILDLPPIKRQKLSKERLSKENLCVLNSVVTKLTEIIEETQEVQLPKMENLQIESSWFRSMIKYLQLQFESVDNTNQKIRILSMLPDEWNFQIVKKYFNCSRYMFTESKKTKALGGMYNHEFISLRNYLNSIKIFYYNSKNVMFTLF